MLGGLDICTILNSNPEQPKAFQSYLASFVKSGDPNSGRAQATVEWEHFGTEGEVLKMDGVEFKMVQDEQVPEDRCGFWQEAEYCRTCG